MKRLFSLLLILCVCFTTVFPMTAYAAEMETQRDFSDGTLELSEEQAGELTSALEDNSEETLVASCDTPVISPFSEFIGEDNEYYTRIRLTVTDRQGNPLSGAAYGLYTTGGWLVEHLITDASGVAESGDVPVYTDYYLEEINPPEGYQSNTGRREIILAEICAPSLVGVSVEYDPIMGRIVVIKIDENGTPLSGAGFYVYNTDTWELVDIITTDRDGIAITTDLPYGLYELYEYLTPENYESDGVYYAKIEYDGETVELHIVNYYNPPYIPPEEAYVSVYKTGIDGRKILGAVFSIFTYSGQWVEDITTNNSGYAYSSALPLGDYYLMESCAPEDYRLDDTPYYFTLEYTWQTVYFDFVNERAGEPGTVMVVKTDENDNPLSGVVFGLYRAWDGTLMQELVTGEDGTAESGLLYLDDYYLVELSGKEGYDMETGRISFSIDGTGETVTVVVINPKIRVFGKVCVTKVDDAGNPLSGVRFGLYCSKGNLLQEIITGTDGTDTSGVLNAGDYYLVELSGLPGYVTDEQQYSFSITENGVTVPVTVTNPRVTGGVRVIKTGEDGEPLPGVVFGIYQDGVLVQELTTGADGIAESGTLYYGDYELRELLTVAGYELLAVAVPFSILENGVVIEIPITNPLIYGGVSVLKTDESGTPLSGAVFGLYNGQDQLITELTTGGDGIAEIYGLVMGSYYLMEHSAPEGFAPSDEAVHFSITEQGVVFETTIVNIEGRGTLSIVKTGEDGDALSGVVFEVYRTSDDERITEITTDDSGTAEIELPLGAYYLLETQTAEGYMLPEGGFSFSLTEHGATVELSIQNQLEPDEPDVPTSGYIKLIKKADGTDALLSGAVFGVYEAASDTKVAELTTGSDGAAVSGELPAGSYYLMELTAPSGYELNDDKVSVTVTAGETIEITVYNTAQSTDSDDTGKLRLIKEAADTGERLSGAIFGIYKTSDGSLIAKITTGSNGTATYELEAGRYYLLELEAPEGYVLDTDKISFTLSAGATKTVTVTNTPEEAETGNVRLIKKDENTSQRLSSAVFGIYKASDDGKVAEITTGTDGTANYKLETGRYYLLELEAPSGYKLKTDKISFTVKTDETTDVTVTNALKDPNAPVTGNLYLVKKAEGTGAKLPGAVFGIYRASDNVKIDEITTDSDGVAVCELAPNNYYLRELKAPEGFMLEQAKIPFTIKADTTVRVEVTNMRDQGTGNVRLIKTGPDGEVVSGAVFGVYRVSDDLKVAEITTGSDGTALYELSAGAYYLLEQTAPSGYTLNTDKHSFTVTTGQTVEVRVVNQRAAATSGIEIPRTGDSFPIWNYLLSALFFGAAAVCGWMLYKKRGRRIKKT